MKVKRYTKAAAIVFASKAQCYALFLIFKEQIQFLPALGQLPVWLEFVREQELI